MTDLFERVEGVRRFNRFYTQKIGVLDERLLRSPFSLAEARVIYELGRCEPTTAAELVRHIGLDAGYLSRILRGFKKRGLISKKPSKADRRQTFLTLTEYGKEQFTLLNTRAYDTVKAMLGTLSAPSQVRLLRAMQTIEELLTAPEGSVPYTVRPHRPGDLGWIVYRHGVLYTAEHGWDERFEALVADIVMKFVQHYDPARERCWIAEMDGQIVGSVILMRESDEVAKLRFLLVEPGARGQGLGRRLVNECMQFARAAGYRRISLWTNSVLHAARRIYEQVGFRLVAERSHYSFGPEVIGQTWEVEL